MSSNDTKISAIVSDKSSRNPEPTTALDQGQEAPGATVSDQTLAGEPMETDTTALFTTPGSDRARSPSCGATRSSAKPGSSSSSDTKEVETLDGNTHNHQMEVLDHLSRDPSMWSAEVLQAVALNHVSTSGEMSRDPDHDWKLIRNDSLQQSPLSDEECIRQRIIVYTRLDRDVRIPSFIHLFDPTDKSFYYFVSNEAGFEQTVNLDFKEKTWEKRVESQRTKLLKLESDMSDLLNQLNLRQILRSKSAEQKGQRIKMLNIMCTMSVIIFKELVYSGLAILNSRDCFKEFDKVKRDRDDFFLKGQSQIIKTIYEGLSHLNRNGFYIPQLRKDYFVRDSERRESEEQVMVQESKKLVTRLKKAHSERSGILTIENPHEVTAKLAKLLGEAKRLKKETPVTYQDLEAQNMEEFSGRMAQVLSEVMGTSAATNTFGTSAAANTLGTTASSFASTMSTTPMILTRLFQTQNPTPQPQPPPPLKPESL